MTSRYTIELDNNEGRALVFLDNTIIKCRRISDGYTWDAGVHSTPEDFDSDVMAMWGFNPNWDLLIVEE